MKWLILAPVSFAFTLMAILLAPVLALFVQKDKYLPNCLWWFQTPDNPAVGDAQYRYTDMMWTDSSYLHALFWLARNPAYGFDHAVGAKIKEGFMYRWEGDEATSNAPLHNGWLWRTVTNTDGSRYWNFYYVRAWSATRCIKINLGWKLWREIRPEFMGLNGKVPDLLPGQVRQLVCTINPFTKRS